MGLVFFQGAWRREIRVGDVDGAVFGLVELEDNNPLVCADVTSVPSAAGTLALVALGPLARACLLLEPPLLQLSFEADEERVARELAVTGWSGGVTLDCEPRDLGGVLAAAAIAEIPTLDRFEELDELYEEAYGRSFFVREAEEAEWHVDLVRGRPNAAYRLRLTPGDDRSLLTVLAMADAEGKCGAAQIVHAMNVMACFEEGLGIPDQSGW